MEMARFLGGLEADLAAVAAVGDDETAAAAERLIQAIRGSAGLRLLDALGEAALEVSGQLPSGHVDVRLSGQDPTLVFVAETEAAPAPDDGLTSRITLRLPETLKTSVEAAAAREGISVNSWLVRALSRSVAPRAHRSGNRLRGFAQS
ncbi:MAG: toxin-antitoxin system HicB family antitoxin [Actinobacteria bacterium]|nr:toxin-antitoxin system HicB family antitoxin [Actinomycetota bacterium]